MIDIDQQRLRPVTLDRLIAGAERLARGHQYLRIDCYEIAGRPLFGEFTAYPGSGLLAVVPATLDRHMGALWRQAREKLHFSSSVEPRHDQDDQMTASKSFI